MSDKNKGPFKCVLCHKRFPSPEAGSDHLELIHHGAGFLEWAGSTKLPTTKRERNKRAHHH